MKYTFFILLLGILFLTLCAGVLSFWGIAQDQDLAKTQSGALLQFSSISPGQGMVKKESTDRETVKKEESKTAHMLCGQVYKNEEWEFELQCPEHWTIDERRVEADNQNVKSGAWRDGQLIQVNIFGDGYFIAINKNGGMGLPPDKDYEIFYRTIAGRRVKIIQDNNPIEGKKFAQFLGLNFSGNDYSFRISSSKSEDKGIIYSILDSFKAVY